jgi:hypothetical protein
MAIRLRLMHEFKRRRMLAAAVRSLISSKVGHMLSWQAVIFTE